MQPEEAQQLGPDPDSRPDSADSGARYEHPGAITVLIVDDDDTNRVVFRKMLERRSHRVVEACDGEQALEVFDQENPDIVLMDIMMPRMDGYEATRRIKEISEHSFLPVIFLTALTDEQSLARCVECGGDDFITKPVSSVVLNAKIDAFSRTQQLYKTVEVQRDELSYHHTHLRYEHEVAERMFNSVVGTASADMANVRYVISPKAVSTGDFVFAAYTPGGSQRVMVGDFTGHGLAAAVGVMPVSDTFHAMTRKGFSGEELVAELNNKLNKKLPTDVFLAACIVDFDPRRGYVHVWNGGLPDVLIAEGPGEPVRRMASKNVPLGVVPTGSMESYWEECQVSAETRVLIYSDGITEATDPQGAMFGQQGLEHCLRSNEDRKTLFDEINASVARFRGESGQGDDATLLELVCDGSMFPAYRERDDLRRRSGCGISMKLSPEALRAFDPMPLLDQVTRWFDGIRDKKSSLYAVLAELYWNALDFGVLGMDPKLKETAEGLSKYHEVREQRLAALDEGWIELRMENHVADQGRRLIIKIEDSGPGFDTLDVPSRPMEQVSPRGRGIELVKSLCHRVTYEGAGNRVRVEFPY